MYFSKVSIAVIGCVLSANPVSAYTIDSLVSPGCHEKITVDALRAVRGDLASAAPLLTDDNERALIGDLEFTPPIDMKDLGGATLLMSVRDNDLKGRGSTDLDQLAQVHGDPRNQDEHCLRKQDQKEPNGSADAVRDCRSFIQQKVSEALEGLDISGSPDLSRRTPLIVQLPLRGQMTAQLPTYYVRMGQAIHAVQDSFTHTFRTPDGLKITVALNWLNLVNGAFLESRDGPAHLKALDACDDQDEFRAKRRLLATAASIDFLKSTLDPSQSIDAKRASIEGLLNRYLTYLPGCSFDNNWCNAPELLYKTKKGSGCNTAGQTLGPLALLGLAGFCWLGRKRRSKSTFARALFAVLITGLLMGARAAQADPLPRPVTKPVLEPGPKDPSQSAWGGYLGFSGAFDKPAVAGTVGGRFRLNKRWTFGIDAEWNPWIAITGGGPRAGSANLYGTVILGFPLAYEKFNLRTTFNLGGSYLLTRLYGADVGSIGLYAGFSPLGLEWKASKTFLVVINPLSFAMPAPKLSGVPLTYPQYRFSIGISFFAG